MWSPTLNSSPPFPFNRISLGPVWHELDITNFLSVKASNNTLGRPSYLDVKTNKSDCLIKGYGFSTKLIILTNQAGLQLYTGNHLSEKFNQNQGLCLEAQHYPDSPNNNKFPTTKLMAKEKYYSETTYLFGVI